MSPQHNVSGVPRSRKIYNLLSNRNVVKSVLSPVADLALPKKLKSRMVIGIKKKILRKPELKPETEAELRNYFRADIEKLQDLIHRDLSNWIGT